MSAKKPVSSRLFSGPGKGAALDVKYLRSFSETLWGHDVHAKRVESISNAAAGTLHAALLAIHAIGAAYAALTSNQMKHGVKQVDRLLSNEAFEPWELAGPWVRFVLSGRPEALIALDWTDFEPDDHTTLCAYLITSHGRATPLLWWTVKKSELKDNRTDSERALIDHLATLIPTGVRVTLLADRGFGDQSLYLFLASLASWDYVIRFRECILVEDADGDSRPAFERVGHGRPTMLKAACVTADRTEIPAVVLARAKGMKEAWCLATSRADLRAAEVVKLYGKRFRIEETFRDEKNDHFGMGLHSTHIRSADRRDRLLFLAALAHTLLTLLGAASEASGLDRMMKANTSKKRTHSLFRQGLMWYDALPNTRDEWATRLLSAFDQILNQHAGLNEIFGVV